MLSILVNAASNSSSILAIEATKLSNCAASEFKAAVRTVSKAAWPLAIVAICFSMFARTLRVVTCQLQRKENTQIGVRW